MRILLIAPYFDKNVPGESWSTYKWVEGISKRHEVVVLTAHRKGWLESESPVAAKKVVNWRIPKLPSFLSRLDREIKPTYVMFYFRARRWIKNALRNGDHFDLVHQINPLALRYPSPAHGLGLKLIVGPLAGSVNTPKGFLSESSDRQWYRKLRNLDRLRIKYDPWLRKTYSDASLILGVAPYVLDILKPAGVKRFEIASETGIEKSTGKPKSKPQKGEPIRLLYVGRIIRTKGVIDAIRAVAMASKSCNITFDVVGAGDMLETCKGESLSLDVSDIVRFHGRVSRLEVDEWYKRSHIFLFPSFREPSGNVVFEAMGHGLPVITSTEGGPGYVVDDSCGIKVNPKDPDSYAKDLAQAIIAFSSNIENYELISDQSIKRIESLALWETKHRVLDDLIRTL